MKLVLQFASGPLAFLVFYALPYEGPSPEGRVALAIFVWMVVWWMTQPVPWGVTSFLPLILFPALGLMNTTRTVGLYGQNIFFWIMGTVLIGYTIQRHGLAKRVALWFLSRRALSGSTYRLAFGFMLATSVVSMFISDAATVAMMMPVGISLVSYVRTIAGISPSQKSQLGTFFALGCLYGALVGGCVTVMGTPYNALSVDLLQTLTGRPFGFFNWMVAGVPIYGVTLFALYAILRLFLRPEIAQVPGGREFIASERAKLGPLSSAERGTIFVFAVMVFLFTLPTLLNLTLGGDHPISKWGETGLSVWVVPPTVILLLFSTPANWQKREFLLTWREVIDHAPWDIMLLCAGAVGVTNALEQFGFVKFIENEIAGMGLGQYSLPVVTSLLVAFGTNFLSGTAATALFGTILLPVSQQIGWNPLSMAMLIPNMATGIIFPWAGATSATAFASGEVEMKDMIRIGVVATVVFAVLVTGIHMLLAPVL